MTFTEVAMAAQFARSKGAHGVMRNEPRERWRERMRRPASRIFLTTDRLDGIVFLNKLGYMR